MSDFMSADIDDLMNGNEAPADPNIDPDYAAALKQDREMLFSFRADREHFAWPEPVRKRHRR